jgi:hypothetical protein
MPAPSVKSADSWWSRLASDPSFRDAMSERQRSIGASELPPPRHRSVTTALPQPTTDQLLRHMRKFYSDRHIAEDVDSVLLACDSDEQRSAVRQYARARRRAPGFRPSSYSSCNHAAIAAEAEGPRCQQCGAAFTPQRSSARFCSARCRMRHSRNGPVTLTLSEAA